MIVKIMSMFRGRVQCEGSMWNNWKSLNSTKHNIVNLNEMFLQLHYVVSLELNGSQIFVGQDDFNTQKWVFLFFFN